MHFDEEMERRLQNWARWQIRLEAGPSVGTSSLSERVDGAGWDAPTVVSTNDAEAEETERGLRTMEPDHYRVVRTWYVHPGSVATRCKKVGLSETTVRTRVAQAQRALSAWLADRHRAAQAERARVEALQRLRVSAA